MLYAKHSNIPKLQAERTEKMMNWALVEEPVQRRNGGLPSAMVGSWRAGGGVPSWRSGPAEEEFHHCGVSVLKKVGEAFNLHLEMIRQALNLTTVAVLWPDSRGETLRIRGMATVRSDIDPGPYPVGKGITGAFLQGRDEIAAAPVRESFPALPYYRERQGVGGIFALRLRSGEIELSGGRMTGGILLADRVRETPWTEGECRSLRLAARRLSFDLSVVRQLQEVGRERTTFERVCGALRELNGALGLRSAFEATIKAIRMQVDADFISVSLADERCHHVLFAEGPEAGDLRGKRFPLEQGLVGKAMKFDSVFPAEGDFRGGSAVFGHAPSFADYRSLLIIPLRREKGPPTGALVVAARKGGVFRGSREILELIAAQVAVKIDLARAHEQISEMATTDALTGMANQRAFCRGFDLMLQRARRRNSPLGLIVCDIDHFKRINDTYGHPFGDKVLQAVAGALTEGVRVVDLAARNGGEEFAVVLEDSDRSGALQVAERLRRAVENMPLRHGGEAVRVTISLGVTVFPDDGEKISQLVNQADQALYHAKKSGRNRLVDWRDLPTRIPRT